jgi:uncharacterized protein YndB with AHSA1/START domain
MLTSSTEQTVHTLEVTKQEEIAAPIDIVFETILEQIGPLNEAPDGTPLAMKLEPWPGGRWFRDLGNNTGHLWGHLQSIRPNDLLEIHGPMFMSAPAVSHVLFRLKEEGGTTRIQFSHRAIGQIPSEFMDGIEVNKGWNHYFSNVRAGVERRMRTV